MTLELPTHFHRHRCLEGLTSSNRPHRLHAVATSVSTASATLAAATLAAAALAPGSAVRPAVPAVATAIATALLRMPRDLELALRRRRWLSRLRADAERVPNSVLRWR